MVVGVREVAMWCGRWSYGGGGHVVWEVAHLAGGGGGGGGGEVAMWCERWPCGVGGGHVVWEVVM